MALQKQPDGSIALRHGAGAVFEHLTKRYGSEPGMGAERIGGSILMLEWDFERDGVEYAAIASAGLERIPFDAPPVELVCEVRREQIGAAAVALNVVARRAIEELEEPWEPGRVWINDGPLLRGTRIAALVMGPSGDGDAVDVMPGTPESPVVSLQTVTLLTAQEGRAVARGGLAVLDELRRTRRAELLDVERTEDLLPEPAVDRDDDELARTPVIVSKLLRDLPARWVECDEAGEFAAYSREEPDGFFDDPANAEIWSLANLISRNPEVADFARTATAGTFLTLDQSGDWVRGRL